MSGRTHGQVAVPITFGLKIAVYALEIHRHLERLDEMEKRLYVGKMTGATGSGAAFGPKALEIQQAVMDKLGLGIEEATTQIVGRDTYAEFIDAIGTHGPPFVMIAIKPDLGQILELLVYGNVFHRQVAVVVINRHALGIIMVKDFGRFGVQQKIFG